MEGGVPLLTLATNFLGAVAIGFLSGLFSQRLLGERGKLFWQTGVCGGFTTFSTFSLEAVTLFQNGRYLLGGAYVLLSVALCVAGVLLGQCLAGRWPIRKSIEKQPGPARNQLWLF